MFLNDIYLYPEIIKLIQENIGKNSDLKPFTIIWKDIFNSTKLCSESITLELFVSGDGIVKFQIDIYDVKDDMSESIIVSEFNLDEVIELDYYNICFHVAPF
jgi:hypothetical protein